MDLKQEFNLTYLFISHNLAVVRHMANRIGVMYLGRVVEIADGRELFRAPKHPYTRMLLDAVPDIGLTGRKRIPVSGEIPNPIDPPSGCAFNPRCVMGQSICRTERPELRPLNGDLVACHFAEELPAVAAGENAAEAPALTRRLAVLAAVTDWIDGHLARQWQQESRFGAAMDPIADKAMVVIALVVITGYSGMNPWLILPATVILFREVFVSGLREFA